MPRLLLRGFLHRPLKQLGYWATWAWALLQSGTSGALSSPPHGNKALGGTSVCRIATSPAMPRASHLRQGCQTSSGSSPGRGNPGGCGAGHSPHPCGSSALAIPAIPISRTPSEPTRRLTGIADVPLVPAGASWEHQMFPVGFLLASWEGTAGQWSELKDCKIFNRESFAPKWFVGV